MRYSVAAGIALFLFLVVYFLLYGPLGEHPEAYPPSNRNVDVEDQAKPQPTPAP